MRPRLAITALLVAVSISGARAQQFSADLVGSNTSGRPAPGPGRIYVADGKARIETADLPDSFLLVDPRVPTSYLVRPAQRIFMDSKQSSRLTRLFVPLDPTDPCAQWRTMAAVAGLTGTLKCQAAGRANVQGRSTVKFAVVSARGRSLRWVDTALRFPLQIEAADGAGYSLRNIRTGAQPPDKFEIPAGYRKFDPHVVLEKLKQTDIWVEPPH